MMPKIATFVSSYALLWVAQHNQVDAFSFQLSRRESLALVGGMASVVAPNTLSIFPANAIDEEETVATTENATREEEAVTTTETATKEEEEPAPPPPPKYKSSLSEETPRSVTRMGGLLEPFQDGPRRIVMMVPSGWNKFDGEVGAYDLKWQDLVDKSENIKVSSSPVKSTTTAIDALGDVQDVGKNLAAKRNAKLISAKERLTDGVLFYKFDFAIGDGTHQLLQLCVCKGKLWSIDASSTEKRWSKRSELYENVFRSFMPKLA